MENRSDPSSLVPLPLSQPWTSPFSESLPGHEVPETIRHLRGGTAEVISAALQLLGQLIQEDRIHMSYIAKNHRWIKVWQPQIIPLPYFERDRMGRWAEWPPSVESWTASCFHHISSFHAQLQGCQGQSWLHPNCTESHCNQNDNYEYHQVPTKIGGLNIFET